MKCKDCGKRIKGSSYTVRGKTYCVKCSRKHSWYEDTLGFVEDELKRARKQLDCKHRFSIRYFTTTDKFTKRKVSFCKKCGKILLDH